MATIDYKQKIKDYMNGSEVDTLYKSMLNNLFPELKESENIRIIKAIKYGLDHVFTNNTTVFEVTKEQCLAWLEKQGEHANFRNKIQIGDKVTRNEDGVLVNLSQLKRVAKPAEEYNITGIGSKNAQGKLGEMIKNLKPVNEVLEQKPAWSEEDEEMWSKTIFALAGFMGNENKIDWLKSLKERVQPQSTWKPSDEQIETLESLIKTFADDEPHCMSTSDFLSIKDLLVDLKKLHL